MGPLLGPHAQATRARETRATGPGCPPQGRAAWGSRAPDTRRPSQWREVAPAGRPPAAPAARNTPQGTHAEGTVPGPRTRTAALKAVGSGPQLPAPRTGSRGRTTT